VRAPEPDGLAPADFAPAYRLARDKGYGCTVHAGEWAGPESVRGGLELPVIDERKLAADSARLIGTDHHDTVMHETDFLTELARVAADPDVVGYAVSGRAGRRGGDPYGPLVVRCRSCNAARSARVLSRLLGPDPSPAEVSDTLRTQPPPVVG
jgi:hypothetical protein